MVRVRRETDRVKTVVLVFEMNVLRATYWYAQRNGSSLEEKESFLKSKTNELNMHSVDDIDDIVVCWSDINGHIDRHTDGYDGVHGECGVHLRNVDGRLLETFCQEKELCL